MMTRSTRRIVRSTAMGALLATASIAWGQGAHVIMMDDSNEAAPRLLHFSMPDCLDLRQPDFTRRDIPIFREKLVLSDDQITVIERLIDSYLESFTSLIEEHLPKASEPMRFPLGGPGGGENGEPAEGAFIIAPAEGTFEELGDLSDMIDPALNEMDGLLPRQLGIGVDVTVGGPGEEGAPPEGAPRAGVVISLVGPEGEEVPEETRKQMEEAATRIAEQLQKRLEEQEAQGGEGGPLLPLAGAASLEEIEQRQAEFTEKAEELKKAKANLRQKFVTDAHSYLATEQIERWPALERTLLRQRSLPKGRLAGERVDLVRVLGEVKPDDGERSALANELEGYEAALDFALKQRDSFLATATRNIDEAMGEGDPDKALSIVDRATTLRAAVKTVNMQHADLFASKLPAEKAASFSELVRKISYPDVYRTTHAQRAFAAAKKIDGLDDTVRAAIAGLESAYATELASVNAQLRQVIDRHQPLEARRPFENSRRVMAGDPPNPGAGLHRENDPIREAFERRRELDRKYIASMTDLLTPEQAAQLPKPPTRATGQPIIIRREAAAD